MALIDVVHDLLRADLPLAHILKSVVHSCQSAGPELDWVGLDLTRSHQLLQLRHPRSHVCTVLGRGREVYIWPIKCPAKSSINERVYVRENNVITGELVVALIGTHAGTQHSCKAPLLLSWAEAQL